MSIVCFLIIIKLFIIVNCGFLFNFLYSSTYDNFFTYIYHMISVPTLNFVFIILSLCIYFYYIFIDVKLSTIIYFIFLLLLNIYYFPINNLYSFTKINTLLLNSLNTIHPCILYCVFIYFIIIFFCSFKFFLFQKSFFMFFILKKIILIYTALSFLLITIYFGSW